jgi:short subunit dehydrogenase-like uncharacterized protein
VTPRLRVLVLGAGGELGARVCRGIASLPGVELVGASRTARGPAGVPMQRADATDAASVARLLEPGALVANCAGPFQYDPAPLVAACISARAHYCDLADDVGFVERVRAAAGRAGAAAAGVLVCAGASTLPGLAGLLARELGRAPRAGEIARVAVYLSVGSRNPASAALLASLVAPLGRELPGGGRCFAALRALRTGDGRVLRFGAYPMAFAGGRVEIGARAVPAFAYFGFDRAALVALLHTAAPWLARVSPAALRKLSRALLPAAYVAQLFGTRQGWLAVVAEDEVGRELSRVEVAASARGLDIPAAPPGWIAARLASGAPHPIGSVELGALVEASQAIRWLRSDPARSVRSAPGDWLDSPAREGR